jgi:hypothetical protein
VTSDDRASRWLAIAWWMVCPPFALLVARFSYERACLNPYELLQPIMRHQSGAVLVAAIYLAAHVWLVAAIVLIARAWDGINRREPRPVAWSIDVRVVVRVVAMAAVIAVEQVPRAVWAWLYHAIGVC